ncbi:hypothetical protein N7537_003127 [Penicillium hordei]|uniref:Uncharacterized protein n=1 Tax=Penicillium hordei TaxID=40994 RepID=A0AAD6H9G2_9EURO|nr:uncharacterized protein N7537_003127 [Penicillium hordei]KAJ5618013.1 hypothetical protein N7537_003127 [Penicillium hordei]
MNMNYLIYVKYSSKLVGISLWEPGGSGPCTSRNSLPPPTFICSSRKLLCPLLHENISWCNDFTVIEEQHPCDLGQAQQTSAQGVISTRHEHREP